VDMAVPRQASLPPEKDHFGLTICLNALRALRLYQFRLPAHKRWAGMDSNHQLWSKVTCLSRSEKISHGGLRETPRRAEPFT